MLVNLILALSILLSEHTFSYLFLIELYFCLNKVNKAESLIGFNIDSLLLLLSSDSTLDSLR